MSWEFFRNNATGTQIATKSMVNDNIQKFLIDKNIHVFALYTKADKTDVAVSTQNLISGSNR
jgi:hypothetical protein